MSSSIRRPRPPESGEALGRAWEAASRELAAGWAIYYLHGESTHGSEAPFWIASAAGPAVHSDYCEGFGPTPDAALMELARNLREMRSGGGPTPDE
jgi:hypothetical protein